MNDALVKHWLGGVLGLAMLGCCLSSALAASDAEVVSVTGKGDRRISVRDEWRAVKPRDAVPEGSFVRTGDLSQMALLLADRTQLRLNQNSQLQIKTLADSAEWGRSVVKLDAGRAWSQARPPTAPTGKKVPDQRISMETPAVTLSIRGTDWEVEVSPDGRTHLVVLSGEVQMANDQGSLSVGSGQAAQAEVGKAPVRLLLANPAERVQWVTAWQVRPGRWVPQPLSELQPALDALGAGDLAAARRLLTALHGHAKLQLRLQAAVLEADLLASQGETLAAVALLQAHGDGLNAPARALLARIFLARGESERALQVLGASPDVATDGAIADIELELARGELALFAGDAVAARQAFARVLAVLPHNADAWFALGRIDTERENVRAARHALTAALAYRPEFPQAQAEQATLATLASEWQAAEAGFEGVLALTPDDYTALTGRGLLRLKRGDAEGALADFLRAGVLEPNFARAWLYSAVALYQLGEFERALQALQQAARRDPHDPLPHVLQGLLAADALDMNGAVASARAAQQKMPFLKSLNQVLNNQKGSANLGSSLAAFGLEEWARHYANLAYSPWWAGSHLFLADRQPGSFNKNSELFKGFITDPTVFGASQRHSTLLPAPGTHGRVDVHQEWAEWRQSALIGTLNGLVQEPFPLAYFFSGDLTDAAARIAQDEAHGTNATVGLGLRPHQAIGLFLFGTDTRVRSIFSNDVLPNDPLDMDDRRVDLGVNVRIDSRNQVWLKLGNGQNDARITGTVVVPGLASVPVPLDRYQIRATQEDVQLRHGLALGDEAWLTWGYERATQAKPAHFDVRILPQALLAIGENTDIDSRDLYLDWRGPLFVPLTGALGVYRQQWRYERSSGSRLNGRLLSELGLPDDRRLDVIEDSALYWRGGLQWHLAPQSLLTAVSQHWRRPASVGSLAVIDTLGISVNDRLVGMGGLYRRQRLQLDLEVDAQAYVQAYVDHEAVDNLSSPLTSVVPDLKLEQLESLRNRRDAFTAIPDLERTPEFLAGRVDTVGFTYNRLLSARHTVALRYLNATAKQTGIREGMVIPYIPRHMLRVNNQWSLPERVLLGAMLTWRSERFTGEANTPEQRLSAGWTGGLTAYWENASKRWVLQGIIDNIRTQKKSSDKEKSRLILRASYLF